ncbi:MAG: sigma-70 family RNA polymerase sigma factor [Gammaproteobacteria bacterium]|nr:sigma-70 family RNA polymerase sigma factor [Gammaproteobacteria bacterium]
MDNLSDKLLVKKILAGDEVAFRAFFSEFLNRTYRFALTRVNQDTEAARDIAQATLSKALTNLSRYRGESQLFTWICAICRNESIDWLRRNKRYNDHIVLIEDYPDVRAAVDSLPSPADAAPDAQLQREQAARLIQVALDQLPRKYGNALEWMYIEGYTVREIAHELDLSREATQSLLARAKRAFADVYSTLHRQLPAANTVS